MNDVGSIMDLMIFPYGNAKEKQSSDGTWKFTCQHGKDECLANTLEACAINLYNDTAKWFPFINCVEKSTFPFNSASKCAQQTGLNFTAIQALADSKEGNDIQHQVAVATSSLNPPHQWTPWVVMNGKPLTSKQLDQPLKTLICDAYTGSKPSGCSKGRLQLSYRDDL